MSKKNDYYTSKVITKPWGYEYVIYNDKNNIAITFLMIKCGYKTSLHCHTQKKTGFIILSGNAEVQYGIYKENTKLMKPLTRLIFRPGLFHSIKSITKNDLYLLETENPYDKKDLVRLEDNYGRKAKEYEGKNFAKNLNSKFIKFKKPKLGSKNQYTFNNLQIILEKTKTFEKLTKNDYSTSIAILDGSLVDNRNQRVISAGEIIKTSTLKILSKTFKIKKPLTIMQIIKTKNSNKRTKNIFYES